MSILSRFATQDGAARCFFSNLLIGMGGRLALVLHQQPDTRHHQRDPQYHGAKSQVLRDSIEFYQHQQGDGEDDIAVPEVGRAWRIVHGEWWCVGMSTYDTRLCAVMPLRLHTHHRCREWCPLLAG